VRAAFRPVGACVDPRPREVPRLGIEALARWQQQTGGSRRGRRD